jgi:ligand-binding sensor domain-containing protein
MKVHNLKNNIFSLLLVPIFFTACNGQTSPSRATNNINANPKTEQHPKIVRTLGTEGEHVSCQLLDKNGNLWFSIRGEGAYRYDGKSFTNFTVKDGLCNNDVGAIIQDKSGNILLGTTNGICKYDGKYFTNIPAMDTLNIISLLEDRDGNLWFGAMSKGIYRYDGTNLFHVLYEYKHPFYGDKIEKFISDIIQDKNGNLWFSSWNGGGVWRYDGKDFKHLLPSLDYYKTNQDNRKMGNTQNGPVFLPSNNPFIESQDNISDDMIFSITEDKAGNIWFATRNHGACRFDGKKFTDFGKKEGFSSTNAYAILEDKKGNLWFTTEKDGVWCYDGKTFKNYNTTNGLVNNSVFSMLEDHDQNLWFGTRWFGLSCFDGKTFTTFSQHDE